MHRGLRVGCATDFSASSTDNVFIDVDALQPGDDFVEGIIRRLETCDVLLAVIGRRWLTTTDEAGLRRLDDQGDYLRIGPSVPLTLASAPFQFSSIER